ncbi:cytochrome C [Chitinophaga sp.]|uniref:cytochrome C n=1 Tax=Chitinophaga sp. TaxID=1869181 RepID=UPI002F935C73
MEKSNKVYIFIDEETVPVAELSTPVQFELNTYKLPDGRHTLKIVSKDSAGKEGIRIIPFEVQNGPAVAVEGIKEHAVVDGMVPLMINAYGKGDQKSFAITGSETPQSIPFWIYILVISFGAWAVYYFVTSAAVQLIK